LGDGLVQRWATPADIEEITAFIKGHLRDDASEEGIVHWTRDMLNGRHPTAHAGDVTVVVDEKAGGKIVSTMNLISQTWAYDGISFGCGRPEMVVTDPQYRRRGLIRALIDVIHARSAERGELVLAITGIPWFYNQFGYTRAIDYNGMRLLHWERASELKAGQPEAYRLRSASAVDIPLLSRLYGIHCAASLVSRVRTLAEWRWELDGPHVMHQYHRTFRVVEDIAGEPVGYLEMRPGNRARALRINELAVLPGHSLRAVCEFLIRALKARVEEINQQRDQPLTCLAFALGAVHPAYEVLGEELEEPIPPNSWYIRVPDLPAFLHHIAPTLERRLVGSVMEGYGGILRLNFYRSQLTLVFERGKLVEIGTFRPEYVWDGDACFPELTFLQMLFGHRSLTDLKYAFADCLTRDEGTAVLLQILFPRRHSHPIELG
jgi:GNAT superfamily N-acetyltransferase